MKKYIIVCIIFIIFVVCVSRWRVVSMSDGYILKSSDIEKIEACQNILLLGAKVNPDGSMSPILKERAIAVVDLYESGKACKIIASGVDEEVYAVQKYLAENDVSKEIIFLDEYGVDTFTSLKNLQDVFDINNVVIVTQRFHLPRAVYIARVLGISTKGFVAYKFPYPTKAGMYKDLIREWPASLKAVWQVEFQNLFFGC